MATSTPRFSFSSTPAPARAAADAPAAPTAAPIPAPPASRFVFGAAPQPKSSTPSVPTAAAVPSSPPAFTFGAEAANAYLQQQAIAPDEIVGTLVDLRMYNDWGLGKVLDSETGKRLTIKGATLSGLQIGSRYRFSGKRSRHEKFGEQLDVVQAVPDIESVDALIGLMKRNYKNVGQNTAARMAEFHRAAGTLDRLKEQLIYEPSAVDFSIATDRPVSLIDDEDSVQRRVRDSLSLRFSGLGLPRNVIADLGYWLHVRAQKRQQETQGEAGAEQDLVALANDILEENPYLPMVDVDRYGFVTADMIARRLGIAPDDPMRIAAIVTYSLREACLGEGHMWATREQLFLAIGRMDPSLEPRAALDLALEREEPIVVDTDFGQERFYTKPLWEAETKLVAQLSARLSMDVAPLCPLEGEELEHAIDMAVHNVGQAKRLSDFQLDDSQRDALRTLLTSRCSLHTLTGGPGCGKTAIVEVLMEVIGRTQHEVLEEKARAAAARDGAPKTRRAAKAITTAARTTFCAPVGKAAKVLSARIKQWGVAKTIHSTLECQDGSMDRFSRNADNPLETDFVVADEQSMLSGPLGASFFDAIPIQAHMLMLGDPDQLASIEPGQVLKSLLELDGPDHHRLTKTHRNRGAILEMVKSANAGKWPGPEALRELLARGDMTWHPLPEPTPPAIAQLALEVRTAAQALGGLERIGVICPVRKGKSTEAGWNVTYLNHALRDFLNPDPTDQMKVTGTTFRLNDRVIINKNMMLPMVEAEAGNAEEDAQTETDDQGDLKTYVVNGDTGWLEKASYTVEDGYKRVSSLLLRLDDGRRVEFPGSELDLLNLAYAITVHAAQGSEYGKVFAVVTPGHELFMHRALVMTQWSRAQTQLEIMGDESVTRTVVARPAPQRNCALAQRVRADLENQVLAMQDAPLAETTRVRDAA